MLKNKNTALMSTVKMDGRPSDCKQVKNKAQSSLSGLLVKCLQGFGRSNSEEAGLMLTPVMSDSSDRQLSAHPSLEEASADISKCCGNIYGAEKEAS